MFDRVINASLMTIFARTAQKMKFSIKDYFSKFDQILRLTNCDPKKCKQRNKRN